MLRNFLVLGLLFVGIGAPRPGILARAGEKPRPRQERAGPPAALRQSVARFRARLEAKLAESGPSKGDWGVLVVDADTSRTLYALNADRYFTPASNTKLFTTALAMAALGPDYRFRTTLETRGSVDANGLRGELVLVGRGDPNLSNRKFPYREKPETEGPPETVLAELADAVVARGIRQIEADVVADDTYFVSDRYPRGWTIDDMTYGFAAPVSAICVNDNTLAVEVRPGEREGDLARFSVEPWGDFYQFENQVITGAPESGAPGPEPGAARVWAEREPGSRHVVLRGTIPLGAEPRALALAIEEPAEYAAALLKRLLELRGVRVDGAARARHSSPTARPGGPQTDEHSPVVLGEHLSVTLLEAIRLINKVSQNLHAELLLRTVARERAGTGSAEAGLKLAQEFFQALGIGKGDVVLYDGSGLSGMNLVTPRAVVTLLNAVEKLPWGNAFVSTLPVAGKDGTLAQRFVEGPAAGHIQAKTGTLGSVNALSGFATTLGGTRLVFSIFGNKHNLAEKEATDVVDAICRAMIEEIGGPSKKRR